VGKRFERRFFAGADAVVTLTFASVSQIREWVHRRDVPVVVIPTCADVHRFLGAEARVGEPHAVWCGSVGTWYRFDLAVRLAEALELPFTVLTRQTDLARASLNGLEADVRSVPPEHVPRELHAGDVGLCLYQATFSRLATAPTRLAEYLAAGMPVAVTPGIGDLEQIVEGGRVGVVIREEGRRSLKHAAEELRRLAADPETHERCRRVALERFCLDTGARRYAELYEALVRGGTR
jgi:glycosyltransferase involved in cell wall biosynthesis